MSKSKGKGTRVWLKNSGSLIETAYNTGIALQNEAQYDLLKKNLTTCLKKSIGNVKIHFYGSRMIGLGNKGSDLDIYVEQGDNYHDNKNVDRDQDLLQKIADALKTSDSWTIIVVIKDTCVPVINCIYRQGNLKCDIAVSNGLAVENSKIIRYLFDRQPEAMKLFHFVKEFFPRYEIEIDGYLLTLMVIFYFQVKRLLPSIEDVQRGLPVKRIDGWETQLNSSRGLQNYQLVSIANYRNHIANFFEFYGTFDYSNNVISVHKGKAVTRSAYEFRDDVKNEFLFCIFGPINEMHNIGKYIPAKKFRGFTSKMKSLYDSLLKNFPF